MPRGLATLAFILCLVPGARSAAAVPPLAQGPGGPILVIGTSANAFTYYCAEILRAEGLNEFATADIATVSSATLSSYDLVVLGQMTLTASQVSMFTAWVNGGGNLVVMRPDKQLTGLLGLTDAGATLSDAYLLIDTTASPGAGLVNQTIQFHGTADRYTLNGASSIATLYQNALTATANPAVVWRSVGSNGGKVAAFTYDLALSVVYTRQGNPAWAGQNRDGYAPPSRSDEMFFGNASFDSKADWNSVSAAQVAIPIADEQQRLLANLILFLNASKKPLPRFWYLPFGKTAAIIMTQDDHYNGAAGRFDLLRQLSLPGCSVANWQCITGSAYLFPGVDLMTASQAAAYTAMGFEVAVHINNGCVNYTFASLDPVYTSMFNAFAAQFTGVPSPSSHRMHCVVWNDYTTQADVEFNHGVRLDTTYYYYPPGWSFNPGFFTGSGMPMRFARTDGSMIDVYQAATQIPDESLQPEPSTIISMLANATGPQGYYAVVTVNAHDGSDTFASQMVYEANVYGVPVVSGRQMLQWLDGRNSSSFGSFTWSGSTLGFSINLGPQTNGIQAMVPAKAPAGPISRLTLNGIDAAFTPQTIKGVQYAVFSAASGNYQVIYGNDTTPPVVSITAPANNQIVQGQVTFTAVATDPDSPVSSLQYKVDGKSVSGQLTTAPYSFSFDTSTVPNGSHILTAIASDPAGNVGTSGVITINVQNTPPVVTQNPANVSVNAGQTATFSVTATGGTLSYQWQSKPAGSSTFANIPGANSAGYTTPVTTLADSSTQFLCVVRNGAGATNSTAATLTVTVQAPVITQSPANAAVNVGQAAVFTTTATGGALSYQWQSKPAGSSTFANIPAAASASYTTPPATSTDNGTQFLCIVSNVAGSVTSAAATLTVSVPAPAITQNPTSVSVRPAQTASFTIAATGSNLSYQWQSKPAGSSTFANIAGANSAGYTTPATTLADTGTQFLCIVSNSVGAATSTPATLTVTTGPTVSFVKSDAGTQGNWKGVYGADGYAIANDSTVLPSYAGFSTNNTALYTWDANGAEPRDLQRGSGAGQIASTWFAPVQFAFDVNITDGRTHQIALYALDWDAGGRSETIDILDASTNAGLDSRSVASFVAGQYLIWNISGHVTIRITKQTGPNAVISGVFFGTPQAPAITQNPANVSVNPGQTATFTVTAIGSGLSYQWQSKPGTSSTFANISGATSAGYTTPPASAADNGTQFLCIVSSTAGNITSTAATLTVTSQLQPPTITQNPASAAVGVGQAATFMVLASGGALAYQWQSKPGTSTTFSNIQGATSASYTTPPVSISDSGTQFLCIVSNSAGTGTSAPATLTVTTGPSAAFLQVDTSTQGNWKGLYGADGYGIATSTLNYPSYAVVTIAGASTYVWNPSTSDVRALQIGVGQGLASCWYSGSPFTIDLNLTDSNTHKISIYFLDWDSGNRSETVAISDASTGAVLDTRTVTAFSQGLYLSWNIQGHVKLTITRTGGSNGVASGIFFR